MSPQQHFTVDLENPLNLPVSLDTDFTSLKVTCCLALLCVGPEGECASTLKAVESFRSLEALAGEDDGRRVPHGIVGTYMVYTYASIL